MCSKFQCSHKSLRKFGLTVKTPIQNAYTNILFQTKDIEYYCVKNITVTFNTGSVTNQSYHKELLKWFDIAEEFLHCVLLDVEGIVFAHFLVQVVHHLVHALHDLVLAFGRGNELVHHLRELISFILGLVQIFNVNFQLF